MSVPKDKMEKDVWINFEEFPEEPAARVKFAMAIMSSVFARWEGTPTEKSPITIAGRNAEETRYLWTAAMVFGERLPKVRFDSRAIQDRSYTTFKEDKELGSFWWRYSRTSLYETVFKYHLTDHMIMLEKDPVVYHQKLREKPLKKFLNGELFPEGTAQRVKYAMAIAGSVLVKLKVPPTAAHPIYLRGNHASQLRYVWTAFMVYGQHLPQMKFGSEAIKIESSTFSTKNQFVQPGCGLSLSCLWTTSFFSSSSLYETVFKPHLFTITRTEYAKSVWLWPFSDLYNIVFKSDFSPTLTLTEYPEAFEGVSSSLYKTIEEQEAFLRSRKEEGEKQEAEKHQYPSKHQSLDNKHSEKTQQLQKKQDTYTYREQEDEGIEIFERQKKRLAKEQAEKQEGLRKEQELREKSWRESLSSKLRDAVNETSDDEQAIISKINGLLNQGADINYRSYCSSILQIALNRRRYQIAEFLIKKGANLGSRVYEITELMCNVPIGSPLHQLIKKKMEQEEHQPGNYVKIREALSVSLMQEVGKKGFESTTSLSKVSQLLQLGANIDYIEAGNTALVQALLLEKYAVAEFLVKQGANARIPNKEGLTALDLIQQGTSLYELTLQLEKERALNKLPPAEKYGSLLCEEATKTDGQEKKIKEYLNLGADINHQNPEGYTALMLAVMHQNERLVSYLLAQQADVFMTNKHGEKASDLVSKDSLIYQLLKQAEKQAELDKLPKKDKCNRLLHEALCSPTVSIRQIDTLIEEGADINYQDSQGYTALMLAADANNDRVVEFLLRAGANPLLTNKHGYTARQLVASSSNIGRILKGFELILVVIAGGNNLTTVKELLRTDTSLVDFQGTDGFTAIMAAAAQNNRELVAYLLTLQPNLEIRNHKGKTVFQVCHESMLKFLKQQTELTSVDEEEEEEEETPPDRPLLKKEYDARNKFFKTSEPSQSTTEKPAPLSLSFASQQQEFT